ncbi:MAG: phage holin family protein [Gemmatimonadales bacterium]
MSANPLPIDADVGIPELVQRMSDDSKRLAKDEARLVKLETTESVRRAGLGAMWLGIAFAAGVTALVALTLLVSTLIGRLVAGHMWLGAIITGVVEIVIGAWLVKRGLSAAAEPSYSLEQTRESITDTSGWVKSIR